MYSISAKVWLSLAALIVFLSSCSRESPEPSWEARSNFGNEYKGGLFPVFIVLKDPVDNVNRISWNSRYARIAYRHQEKNQKKQITADTAFLYWEEPPPLYERFDSTEIKKDTTVSWKIDTTRYYKDTIYAIVDHVESSPIIIEVVNILPRIKSITVGGMSQPGDSLLTIAVNLGAKTEIRLELEKPFKNAVNKAFHPIVTMPSLMGKPTLKSENDSVFVYEWIAPTKETDSFGYLKIEDSGGYGDRSYKVHLVIYTECGSVWVASENELVKYSPTGTEVARISDNFSSISDISVNSNTGELFVVDNKKNSFSIYDNYGKQLYKNDSLFKLPSGVAVGVVGNYVWVADAKSPSSVSEARLRRFLMSDSLRSTPVIYEMSGPITGLSTNQNQRDFVWFAIPGSDTVGFTRDPEPKFIQNTWNRPSMVSHDISNGIAWIADSIRIVAVDTTGKVLADIRGFSVVSSVSASKGKVWASDIETGKVYHFIGPFTGSPQDANVIGRIIPGFKAPSSVSAYVSDGGAWVTDKEAGMVVRLDSTGKKITSGTGLKFPILGKTVQVWE